MRFTPRSLLVSSLLAVVGAPCVACSNDRDFHPSTQGGNGNPGSGGSTVANGGSANANGGATTANGGSANSNGGASTANGGSANANGGSSTQGGSANGGSANANGGSSAQGGSSQGGSTQGGAAGASTNGGATNGGAGGGSAGGGSAGGASGCTQGGTTIFCEDFENVPTGTLSKTNGYSPVTNMGTLTVDATHARGNRALHVHTDGNGKAYIQLSPFAPPQNSFFARMYLWVTAFPSAPDYAHFTLVEAAGTGAGLIRPIGGQYIPGKGDLWGAGSDAGPTGDWTNWKESAPAQAGKWLCMEWEMTASNNAINVWIDGTAKPDLSVSTKTHGGSSVDFVFPTFNNIWFGWWLYQAGPTPSQFDLWIDDISLGSTKQGC